MSVLMAKQGITPDQKKRLVEFLGMTGADIVISHIDDLDQTFGSASPLIKKIMEGRDGFTS